MHISAWTTRTVALVAVLLAGVLLGSTAAQAQDNSENGRLREALRRVTIQLRGLQDNQAAMQASLDQANQQRDALQKQIDALNAHPPAPAEAPPDPELAQLREAVQALTDQNKALQTDLQRAQAGYAQAAQVARANDAKAQQFVRQLQVSDGKLHIASDENGKLVQLANDILHLYRTQSFRAVLIGSYEPLLGLKRVELDNMVQDYEDKILDVKYYGNEKLPAPPSPAPASPAPANLAPAAQTAR